MPVIVGAADAAVRASERALERGVFAQAIRPPTVPEGTSRLRLAVMASHTKSELRDAAKVIAAAIPAGARQAAARHLAEDAPAAGAGPPARVRRPARRRLAPRGVRGFFVTGTDTEVGKTVVAAAACAALTARGERVAAFKPAVTGLDDPVGEWPRDHELLAAATGQDPAAVSPYTFGPPLSPHYAAELAGVAIEPTRLVTHAREAAASADLLVCEGIGGFLVPLTLGYLIRDLAVELGLPVVIAARTGLGTIGHTLLTVEAVRAAGLTVAGIVLTPWPAEPAPIEQLQPRHDRTPRRRPRQQSAADRPRLACTAGATLPLRRLAGRLKLGCRARRAAFRLRMVVADLGLVEEVEVRSRSGTPASASGP